MNRTNTKKVGAFTLVELLVVVAIIALLVSILLPSLGRAKEQAKIVVCQTSLKGLGVGYTFYTNQHNQWYPVTDGYGGDPPTWDYRMKDDYGNLELLHCPSDNFDRQPVFDGGRVAELEGWMHQPGNDLEEAPRSYAQNYCLGYRGPSKYGDESNYGGGYQIPYTSNSYTYKTTDVDIPAATYALSEQWESRWWSTPKPSIHGDHVGSGIEDGLWTGSVPEPAPSRSATFYHSNYTKANFLFCDSHVETLPEDHPYLIDTNGNGRVDAGELYYCKLKK